MAVLVPRTRTIGVRLSAEEYSALEKYCVETGARSISDLARRAIAGFLNHATQQSVLVSTVSENAAQLRELEEKLTQLTMEIAMLKGGRQSPNGDWRSDS